MRILNRKEFTDKFNYVFRFQGPNCEDDDHPLWEAEKMLGSSEERRITCHFFVCIKPIKFTGSKQEYWKWVKETLSGEITCFSSDKISGEEWWGFTHKEDIPMWILKWANT